MSQVSEPRPGDVNLLAAGYVSLAAPGKGSMSQSALAYSVSSARNDSSSLLGLNSSVLPDPAQILSLMPSGNSPPHAPLLPSEFLLLNAQGSLITIMAFT